MTACTCCGGASPCPDDNGMSEARLRPNTVPGTKSGYGDDFSRFNIARARGELMNKSRMLIAWISGCEDRQVW